MSGQYIYIAVREKYYLLILINFDHVYQWRIQKCLCGLPRKAVVITRSRSNTNDNVVMIRHSLPCWLDILVLAVVAKLKLYDQIYITL